MFRRHSSPRPPTNWLAGWLLSGFSQNSACGWEFHTGELEKTFGNNVPLVWITLSSEDSLVEGSGEGSAA